MRFRFLAIPILLSLLACGGRAQQPTSSSDGGTPGVGGTSAAAGDGPLGGTNLRPPIDVPDAPVIIGPSPVKCSGTPQPDVDTLRACLLAAGCAPAPLPAPLSDCIAKALPHSPSFTPCLRDARSCADVAACTGTGVYTGPCPKPGASGCVDNKVVYCDILPNYFLDCASRGAPCLDGVVDLGGASYEVGYCGAPTCANPTENWVCDGTKRVLCANGSAEIDDCAVRGLECIDKADGAICGRRSNACAPAGGGTCVTGNSGRYCDEDGRTIDLDCAPLGFTCQVAPKQSHGVACLAAACTAADADLCFEECDGPMAHLCVGGQRLSIDCTSHGFQTCVLESRADVGDRVRCGK
jgi:hypothetical protein